MLAPGARLTGYFEPVLRASASAAEGFRHPLHRRPPEPLLGLTRAEVMSGALDGMGLEIAWLRDPVEAFQAEVQGSARLRFADGSERRINFAARNRHPYVSLGQVFLARGLLQRTPVRWPDVAAVLRAEGQGAGALLALNPSKVYFREAAELAAGDGPAGSAGFPLTPLLSVAADPAFVPPGSLLRITSPGLGCRLMLAEDTGGAIRGPDRADIFFGSGAGAGRAAGALNETGDIHLLEPVR
jgi:membrane-bound lytic murein transglycosylase A